MLLERPVLWINFVLVPVLTVYAKSGSISKAQDIKSLLHAKYDASALPAASSSRQNSYISREILLRGTEHAGVTQTAEFTWRWKTGSLPVAVDDITRRRILKDPATSLSVSFDIRASARRISTVFHAFSDVIGEGGTTWIEILTDSLNDTISVRYKTLSLLLVSSMFNLRSNSHRNWVNIQLSLHMQGSARISEIRLSSDCGEPQSRVVEEGVNLLMPEDLVIEVGGNSLIPTTSFTGLIRNLRLHVPAITQQKAECDTWPKSRNKARSHRKRGATSLTTSGPRKQKTASRRDSARRNTAALWESTLENTITQLRSEVRSCRDDNEKINQILKKMQQAQSSLEERIARMETCECIPMCIMSDGIKRRQGEIWEVSDCKTCSCSNGDTVCQTRRDCVHACVSNPCQNNGQCEENGNTFACRCRRGYYGYLCEHLDQCISGVCENGATCELLANGGYSCECRDGFTGGRCEQQMGPCDTTPCQNSGTCVDDSEGFTCECPRGFYGPLCEEVDQCFLNPCENSGVCTNYDGEYACRCRSGFYGRKCELQGGCHSSPCLNNGKCRETSFVNSEGTNALNYTCVCHSSHSGERCELENPCYMNPCLNGGICVDQLQSGNAPHGKCTCVQGYHGERCEYSDICHTNPCLNGGRCTNEPFNASGFTCTCRDGYFGQRCENQDLCSPNPCLNGGQCLLTQVVNRTAVSHYMCRCPISHFGENCEKVNPCEVNPCQNHGVCDTTLLGEFICRCRPTHYGDRCEFTNYCRATPCRNGGMCVNKPSKYEREYTCECEDGYVGPLCEYEDLCRRNPCMNRGTCHMEGETFRCTCSDSFHGQRCELVDFCGRNPCKNGGRCKNEANGFRCMCPVSLMGNRCQLRNQCRPNPCLNGGRCRPMEQDGYACSCLPSYYGPTCRSRNYCHSNPCLNGGICMNNLNGHICKCASGYEGIRCDQINPCQINPCKNAGICQAKEGKHVCQCPIPHNGDECQYSDNICIFPLDHGICENSKNMTKRRWYFDKFSQKCQSFHYAGCGGNGNNFPTRQACKQSCLVGICCMLRRSSVQINGNKSMSINNYTCQSLSIGHCKRMDSLHNEVQVIQFIPGTDCDSYTCKAPESCIFGGKRYEVNEPIIVRCGRFCVCREGGYMECRCDRTDARREIRRLTSEERAAFHATIRAMKTRLTDDGRNVWDDMRDRYQQSIPTAQSSKYFLLWNRDFLRQMELHMKQVDCTVTLPYFDFTLDAGQFNQSDIWQPNFFGGDGVCVPDHPFRQIFDGEAEQWKPCLSRKFNDKVAIPNMIDVAAVLNSRTYEELSENLRDLVSYVNAFIGGDMATSTRAYDPLFYSVHAYVDYIFMHWQKSHQGHDELLHISGVNDIPLGISPNDLWDGACTYYATASHLKPCNMSDTSEEKFGEDGYNLQGYDRRGFDRDGFDERGYNTLGRDKYGRLDLGALYKYDGYSAVGYDRSGYDRSGHDRFGFDKGGWNRDGYNEEGYDEDGFNRYGLDNMGYDRRGFDVYGSSRHGDSDSSDFYDVETGHNDCCFGRDGITSSGFDRFGFSVEGRDARGCDYFFLGPQFMHYRDKVWKLISIQPLSFLLTIGRNCGLLENTRKSQISRDWFNRPSSRTNSHNYRRSRLAKIKSAAEETNHGFSKRFCFDLDLFLTWCPCLEQDYPTVCSFNPCAGAHCNLQPEARCHINMCGKTCSAEYYLGGRRVNCVDPCTPNPCQHGGTCTPSRLSSASERFQCRCSQDYVGSLCEKLAPDTCMSPKIVGGCEGSISRWYYNFMDASCEEFTFSGCGGNSNNFPSKKACDLRCSLGACCYRLPKNSTFLVGFDRDGYDKYGFNALGYNRRGQQQSAHDSMPTGNRIHPPKGFGPDGYDIFGYDVNGYDRQGYNREGYHEDTGFNRTGYNPDGEFDQLLEYGGDGYNRTGQNRAGYTCNGIDREGFNQIGLYYDFDYRCESLLLSECEALKDPGQLEIPFEVISFSPGKSCEEIECEDGCGCRMKGKVYHFGQTFQDGCQTCTCTLGGSIECTCRMLGRRKEIRDMNDGERSTYAAAIRKLYKSGKWGDFATQHAEHMPQANGASFSLPWHRYFLREVEQELQKVSSCDLHIPYFDWTIDVGNMANSQVWQASFFGGNGDDDTNCISYHPFSIDTRWHPCIKRRFNDSISLPDAVNFRILLHEPQYDDFRIQLEMMSALFHLWVGGHMASPFSPYDPVYISHWAFIDYIWSEWQKKNPKGTSRFPPHQRYVTMKPFRVSPDNVLSSEQQMCVIYAPPTLGSPCNSTKQFHWPPSIRNEDGLDRHGFDESGFDVDGYDMKGMGRSGNADRRKIFDTSGYNKLGYHRSGFDHAGWDKYNYNKYNFNRDGFDIEGFDKSGYDRHGYDRSGKTPFGMFKNTSFAPGFDRGYAASLFDRFGYNRYGFDKNGFNRKGFDIFGFDGNGLDEDKCNFYYDGPYYMRYHYFALDQLNMMQEEMLKNIKRICPPVTPLPDYWVTHIWMEKMPAARHFEKLWKETHQFDTSWKRRTSSITEELLWVPVTPDEQFCFNMDWYSGCAPGTKLMDCTEDLCAHSSCASQPRAQCRVKNCGACYPEFYDGNTGEVYQCYGCVTKAGDMYNEGSTWHEGCNMCVCQAGLITCSLMVCPQLSCSHPAPADQNGCCGVCRGCEYGDQVYRNRQRFQPSSCSVCECIDGSVTCKDNIGNCRPTNCEHPVTMPGECCPTCQTDCHGHRDGETWAVDKCSNCTCMADMMVCSKNPCPVVQCDHPRTTIDECCPKCHGCELNGRKYRHLQNFMKDSCIQCRCTFGNVKCTTQQCPPLTCDHQKTPAGSCCPRCRPGCEYEGIFYDEDTSFRSRNSPCLSCICKNGKAGCTRMTCPRLPCARPTMLPGQCCPQCLSCQEGETVYREGQIWTSENGCQNCVCQNGEEICRNKILCRSNCTHGVLRNGQCCSDCLDCTYGGEVFHHLESFNDPDDICKECSCQHGNIVCSDVHCPPIRCSKIETPEGECCPTCKSCVYDGVSKKHASSWRIPQDACTTCSCQEGRVECRDERCLPARCDYPRVTDNICCPMCSGCSYRGNDYNDGDRVPPDDACTNCECLNGNVICTRMDCPEVDCATITEPGACCPSCATCNYDGKTYKDGNTFIAPKMPCLECTCNKGKANCRRLDSECKNPSCPNPGRSHSECCPACNSCEYQRRNYENGTIFTPPDDTTSCSTCSCLSGFVTCRTKSCPQLTCSNPVHKPGRCCPVCEVCSSNGATYSNGERWQADMCTVCRCMSGHTECEHVICPTVLCTHPAKVPGECCPNCENCFHNGQILSNGHRFLSEADPCTACTCKGGSVTCVRLECPSLHCESPVVVGDACCPSCQTDCEYFGVSISNGDTINHPTERCQKCTCTDGEVECDQRKCARSTGCRHPSSDGCCRKQCTDCRYHGKLVKNGENLRHISDPCKVCTCTNGNMVCIRQLCTRSACDDAVNLPGFCCPECPSASPNCIKNGTTIRHGEQYMDGCSICRCLSGHVRCRPVKCPTTTCRFPARTDCCLSCSGCMVDGIRYDNEQEISATDGTRKCEVCRCVHGDILCRRIQCLTVRCSHPRMDGCCPACDGCTHEDKLYDNEDTFPDPSAPCNQCKCKNGNVICSRKTCDRLTCTHPLKPKGACCPECGGNCLLGGKVYADKRMMFSLSNDTNNCQLCVCSKGSIKCKAKPCPIAKCRHPVSSPCGCSSCDDCLYGEVIRGNRETFVNPENPKCSDCYCSGGNVVCGKRRCESAPCTHPARNDCDCPICDRCSYHGATHDNEETFKDMEDPCNQCICQDGNVQCTSLRCNQVDCSNPVLDECGCLSCNGCKYEGIDYEEQDQFVDILDRCNECSCQSGTVTCSRVRCSAPRCLNPVQNDGDCCPKCFKMCHSDGESFEDGSTFTISSDPCSICSCSSGEIRCVRQHCNIRCTNPITQSHCCADCSACLYQGLRHEEGAVFISRENNCKRCSCYRGNIICSVMQCPALECDHPQQIHGECCPQCPVALTNECVSDGRYRQPSGPIWIQEDDDGVCQECKCERGGIVSCTVPSCGIHCSHPVPAMDRCCSSCESCFYANHTYQNGVLFHPNRCTDCTCNNGDVTCVTRACPSLACAPAEQLPGECCRQCTSCIMNGERYSNGQSWNPPGDVCSECQCVDGVITCSKVHCLQLCHVNLRVPAQCCPVCAGCYFEGKIHEPGEIFATPTEPCDICFCEVSASGAPYMFCKKVQCPSLIDCPRGCITQPQPGFCCPSCADRPECDYGSCNSASQGKKVIPTENQCLSCECTAENMWVCLQKTCNELSCPKEKQYTLQGVCCPVCDECHLKMENMNVPSGKVWRLNECEVCRCEQGYVACMKQTCPAEPPMCEAGMVPYKQSGHCCTVCLNMELPCTYGGRTVLPQQKWIIDQCTTCTCFAGKVNCVTHKCIMLTCNSDESPVLIPGECCPRCLPHPMSCVVFGHMHYLSFDGRILHYNGPCQYLLTADCSKSEFKIIVHNSNYGNMTEQVTILTEGGTVALMRDYTIRVNGTVVSALPTPLLPYYYIETVGSYMHVITHLGVHIYWDGRNHHIEVSVPGSYRRRTCGLCGNFNNYPQDDARLHNSRLAMSDAEFGNDWKVHLPNTPSCSDVENIELCGGNYEIRKLATDKCAILNSPPFSSCHSLVSPEIFFASCVHEACKCEENDQSCLCNILSAYAAHCRRAGMVVRWRNPTRCAVVCAYDRGYVFTECGSPCKRTCANRNLYTGATTHQCYMSCISGCQCPAGEVENDGHCIHPDLCPATISSTVTEILAARSSLMKNTEALPRPAAGRHESAVIEPPLMRPLSLPPYQ